MPVVIVGNVIAGGAGKTPVVMAVARHLRSRGWHVGVVSRGYGRHTDDCREVLADSDPSDVGDEPALIHRSTGVPVVVARRRAQAARALLAAHPATDVVVCDDGLQHLALGRDVEVCVFDDRGVGNGWMLPPAPCANRGRDIATWYCTAASTRIRAWPSRDAATRRGCCGPRRRARSARRPGWKAVTALAAIARPEAFFAMLRSRGVTLAQTFALPDHFDFAEAPPDIAAGHVVLCTEKDAVKLCAWRRTPSPCRCTSRRPRPSSPRSTQSYHRAMGHQAS